jgi:hypothetical protein
MDVFSQDSLSQGLNYDVVLIYQLIDNVTVNDVDILHIKIMT